MFSVSICEDIFICMKTFLSLCDYLGTPGGGALFGLEGTEGGGPGSGDTAGRPGGPGAARPPGRGGPGGARRWGVGLDMGDLKTETIRLSDAAHTVSKKTVDLLLGYLRPDGIPVTCSQESSTGGGIAVVIVVVLMSPMMLRPSRRAWYIFNISSRC